MQRFFNNRNELLTWVKKGDKSFYNPALAGVNLDLLPHDGQRICMIWVPSKSETPERVWVLSELEPLISAIGHALGVWGSEGLIGQKGVRKLENRQGVYSVPVSGRGTHAILADILGVGLLRAGTLAAEIKASMGIELHCLSSDGVQWLA